jgi:1-acyl-sn-glycerol-3-phosphate acyltransferase
MPRLLPSFDPSLQSQTAQSSVTEEEFQAGITPEKCTITDRIIQILLFVFCLGWVRLILLIVVNLTYFALMIPVLIWADYEPICQYLRTPGITLTRVYIRCLYFCFGIFWIKREGEIDESARASFFNHQSIIDGPLLYMYRPFIVIGMAKLKRVPVFGKILIGSQAVFVDRAKSEGQSTIMMKIMEDDRRMSLAMAPEGKTTLGRYLLQFRTGGFLAAKPVQPVTIRYYMYGAFAKTTLSWVVGGIREWLWRVLCTPCVVAHIRYLPVLKGDEYFPMTPKDRALKCQLVMANSLGVRAIDRDSKSIFTAADQKGEKQKNE